MLSTRNRRWGGPVGNYLVAGTRTRLPFQAILKGSKRTNRMSLLLLGFCLVLSPS